jgi:hypothetical protein
LFHPISRLQKRYSGEPVIPIAIETPKTNPIPKNPHLIKEKDFEYREKFNLPEQIVYKLL